MEPVKFVRCDLCGNFFGVIHDSGVKAVCCGQPMTELVANSTDAAGEKHVPVVERDGDKVTVRVGSVAHPMEEKHYIQWIALSYKDGMQRVRLHPGEPAEAIFRVCDSGPVTAYEYCNLHGLWKADA